MRTELVEFFSEGVRVCALWHTPGAPGAPWPAIVQGPGWLGLKDAAFYRQYHSAFTAAGFAVLCIDYRGFGDSAGERGVLSFPDQVQDMINAVTYLTTRDDVDPDRIGVFGTGGTGAGNAIQLAAADPRVRAVVSQVPVADGRDWLRRMRTEYDWFQFLALIEADRRERVATGAGRMVDPKREIMVPTPERAKYSLKADVDHKLPALIPLAAADGILRYRPIDSAAGLTTPLLVIGVEQDATTPMEHARRLYVAAAGPKKLVTVRNAGHYEAIRDHAVPLEAEMVTWFERHLTPLSAIVAQSDGRLPRIPVPVEPARADPDSPTLSPGTARGGRER